MFKSQEFSLDLKMLAFEDVPVEKLTSAILFLQSGGQCKGQLQMDAAAPRLSLGTG